MSVMWSVIGALLVMGFWGIREVLRERSIAFTFWKWAVFTIWLLWSLFSIAFVWTSMLEGSIRAASVGALLFGGTAVVVAVALGRSWFVLKTEEKHNSRTDLMPPSVP